MVDASLRTVNAQKVLVRCQHTERRNNEHRVEDRIGKDKIAAEDMIAFKAVLCVCLCESSVEHIVD